MFSTIGGSPGRNGPKKEAHYPNGKPSGIPLYSDVISYGDLVFVSGHGVNNVQDIRAQTAKVLDDIELALKSAGTTMQKVLKVNVFLKDIADYQTMNEVFRGRFGDVPPVRSTVAVAAIPLAGCLVEIEVVAGR